MKKALLISAIIAAVVSTTANIPDPGRKSSPSASKYKSIAFYSEASFLNVKIRGLGGFSENCLEFELKNMSGDTLYVRLEPGRRILSDDTSKQDILIVKEVLICLHPRETKKIKGYGFCCCAHRGGPGTGNKFSLGYMAPASWVKLAEAVNEGTYTPNAVQHAVWSMSDNVDISSISGKSSDETTKLRRIVAGLKGMEVPWYTTHFLSDTARAFSGKHSRLTGEVPYYLSRNAMVTINIRNAYGSLMKTVIVSASQSPGNYIYDVNLDVKNWPRGDYEIAVYEDGSNLNTKRKFSL